MHALKGFLKLMKLLPLILLVVGDEVGIERKRIENNAIINEIYERRNYIVRSSPHQQTQRHIIASNP